MSATVTIFNQSKRKLFLWFTVPLIVALIIVTRSAWPVDHWFAELIEQAGILLVFACVFGRCWAILYIGDKKNRKLVDQGPYRYTRNPLYFFSALGMAGFGMVFESLFLGVILFVYTYLSFLYVARRESQDLTRFFGRDYLEYCASVPEFIPNLRPSVPNSVVDDQITISPKALKKTFLDACLFLLMLPLAEFIVSWHESGQLAAWLFLY